MRTRTPIFSCSHLTWNVFWTPNPTIPNSSTVLSHGAARLLLHREVRRERNLMKTVRGSWVKSMRDAVRNNEEVETAPCVYPRS